MKEILNLTKFYISSFYKKPQHQMLKVTLFIALFYMLIQFTAINISIFYIVETHVFMFYNLIISSLLVFALLCYLATLQFSSFSEFKILASLPISYRKISTAKLISSIFVPVALLIILQLPILGLLIIDFKFVEIVKLLIFFPLAHGMILLLLLFVLSFVNKAYYKFKNRISYLITNFVIMALFPLVTVVLYFRFSEKPNIFASSERDFEYISDLMRWINSVLNNLYENMMEIPLLNIIIEAFIINESSIPFILGCIILLVVNSILYYLIIHNISIHYHKNGIHKNSQTKFNRSKARITENVLSNYLQREIWVINSEAYFKMQVVLGVLLPPVISLILLLFIANDIFPSSLNVTGEKVFDKYFSYIVLFLCCINNISGTPYSREGKYYYLLKSNPFNVRYVYFSKVIISSAMSIVGVCLSFILFAVFGYWESETVIMLIIVFVLVICYNLLAQLYDSKKPLVDWENPSEAVKSNPNVLISLLLGMPLLIIIAVLHIGLFWLNIHSSLVTFIILLVVLITITILIKKLKTTL